MGHLEVVVKHVVALGETILNGFVIRLHIMDQIPLPCLPFINEEWIIKEITEETLVALPMLSRSRGPNPLLPPHDLDTNAFNTPVVSGLRFQCSKPTLFVKKSKDVPSIVVHANQSYVMALMLIERGLIEQFTGLWPSLHSLNIWVD